MPRNFASISIVMGCYNTDETVEATIRSLQSQTLDEWELIVVDDGSTDQTPSILRTLAAQDPRIRVITQENQGLTKALIVGCETAQSTYIARQDVGDLSLPERLARQYTYLESNRDVVAVGCSVRYIGPEGEFLGEWIRRQSPTQTTNDLLHYGKGFVHPSVMFRRTAYLQVGGYRPQFRYAQDHDLWYRLAEVGQLGSCPEVLFEYRQELDGVSPGNRATQNTLGELARRCWELRTRGEDEAVALTKAAELSARVRISSDVEKNKTRGIAAYFIGSRLYALGDPRCRVYFSIALKARIGIFRSSLKWLGSLRYSRRHK